ncbi:IclR family transcriptional regulator [Afifella sp. IM 167]|uniref:IclR family transcriptional regulator n=1 Tax=Afifella sp. IM 167 TaxID=2033586 RepID=UPI001CCBE073|nr:IclR family transcriptional regulator [Afifella sp. IM 167]
MPAPDSKTASRPRGRPRQGAAPGHADDTPAESPAVGTLARGLAVLRCFRAEDRVIGTQEIARRTELPKATVSRLAATLAELGYLRFVPEVGKYALSSQVLTLGYAALGRTGLGEFARPFIEELISTGDCAVAISIRDDLDMMFVELARRPSAILLNLTVGARIPMLWSAPGRAYLAGIEEGERERLLERLAAREGAGWPQAKKTVEEAIERARRQGFADAIGSWRPEHNAIGTVLRDPTTGEIYTLSLGGLASGLPRERLMAEFAPRLLAAAETINSRLSGLV